MPDTKLSVRETLTRASQRLSPEAQRLFQRDLSPVAFAERLLEARRFQDALILTAHVLPPKDSVWWGILCAWKKARPEPSEKEAEAFRAALRWIQHPDEQTRRAAHAAADLASTDTPAGCIALAVFFSGGSISEPRLPAVEPPPDLCAKTIIGALKLAAILDGAGSEDAFHRYVLLAQEPLRRLLPTPMATMPAGAEDSIASAWGTTEGTENAPPLPAPARAAGPPTFDPDQSVVDDSVVEPAARPHKRTKKDPGPTPGKKPSSASRIESEKDMLDTGMSDIDD